jgi:hypothetical protein
MLHYAVAMESGGARKPSAGGFAYLARQSEEQSSIGFQPVSNGDDGWSAFTSRRMTPAEQNSKVGWWFDTGWKQMLLYTVAMESGGSSTIRSTSTIGRVPAEPFCRPKFELGEDGNLKVRNLVRKYAGFHSYVTD